MTLLSIIIPVFNAEKYIDRCIQSILDQTISDYEIICVDDCSTDNSRNILKDYAKKYNNFKFFTMERNSGSGKCRNLALKNATGKYIALLDSDDYIVDKNAYEIMLDTAKKYNSLMVSANMQYQVDDKIIRTHHYFKNITETKIRKPEEYVLPWYHVKNIINREFIVENDIHFPDLKRGQDPVFFSEILTRLNFYVEVPVWYYCYTSEEPVINKMNTFEKFRDYLKCHEKVFSILDSKAKFRPMLERYASEAKTRPNKIIPAYNKSELQELISIQKNILSTLKIGHKETYHDLKKSFKTDVKRILTQINDQIPFVSIILPVYNVEPYLKDCLDSIKKQTLKNFEVICINDGSTDNSLKILEEYSKKDKRFKIYSQKNQGLGKSRNNGIKYSNGDYILFLDSDDWIAKETLEELVINALYNNSDIVLYDSIEKWADGSDRKRLYFNRDNQRDYNDYVFDYKAHIHLVLNYFYTAPTKFFKRSFILENNLIFYYRLFEDVQHNVESIISAKRISYLPKILYYIRRGERQSLTSSTAKTDKSFIIFDIVKNIQNFLKQRGLYEEFEEEFHLFYLATMLNQLDQLNYGLKTRFYALMKKQLPELNLKSDIAKQLKEKYYTFYMHIVNSENYAEFALFNKSIEIDILDKNENILLNQIQEKNAIIEKLEKENMKLRGDHEILVGISNDLRKGNFLTNSEIKQLSDYNLFNEEYYRLQYYYNSDIHPLLHYLYKGIKENKKPSSVFDAKFYAEKYDITDMNPLIYYIKYGMKEGKIAINNNERLFKQGLNWFDLDDKINKLNKLGINEDKRDEKIIVTLTSFPERINEVKYTIYSLFEQKCKADEIVLWLSADDFPNKENDLPRELLFMKNYGLTILWTENLYSYKKIIPAINKYSSDVLVTADDDIYYSETWLQKLVNDHEKYPDCIISHRARSINFIEDKVLNKYLRWPIITSETYPSFLTFLTSGGGALFPPNSLHRDVTNKELFTSLSYGTDDIWLWAMAILNHTKIKVVKDNEYEIKSINLARDNELTNLTSLWLDNETRNDDNINKIIEHYPEILETLSEEYYN